MAPAPGSASATASAAASVRRNRRFLIEWADPELAANLKHSTQNAIWDAWTKGRKPALQYLLDRDSGASIHASRLRSISTAGGVIVWSNAALPAAGSEERPGGSSAHTSPPKPRALGPEVGGMPVTVAPRAPLESAAAILGPVFRYEWADPSLAHKQSTRNAVTNAWHKCGVPEVRRLLDKDGGASFHALRLRSVSTGGNIVWSNAALLAAKREEPAAVVEEQSGGLTAHQSGLRKRCREEAGLEAGPGGGSTVPPSRTSPVAITGKVEEGGPQSGAAGQPDYGVGSTAAHAAVRSVSVAGAPRGQGGAGAAAAAALPMQLPGAAPPLPSQADEEDDDVALEALLRRAAVMTAGKTGDKALLLHAVTAWFDR